MYTCGLKSWGNFSQNIKRQLDRLCGLGVRVPRYRSRGPGFGSRRYHIFWEVVGLERPALSLVSRIEELLGRNSSGSGLENRKYGRGDPFRWPRNSLYQQKLALTSPISGGRLVGIVCLRTKATDFFCVPTKARYVGWSSLSRWGQSGAHHIVTCISDYRHCSDW
jgi:hypothetical protein